MHPHAHAASKPMPVPSFLAGGIYFIMIASVVVFRLAVKKYRLFPSVLALCLGMQAVALLGVPLAVLVIRWRNSGKSEEPSLQRSPLNMSWLPRKTTIVGLIALALFIWCIEGTLTELQIWQAGAVIESLAFGLLAFRAIFQRSVAGMSMQKIRLDCARLSLKVIATLWLGRRLPRKSGDGLVIGCDCFALACTILLFYCAYYKHKQTYQLDADVMPVRWFALVAILAAAVLRFDIGQSYVPDVLWTQASFLDLVVLFPQFGMIAQNGGVVEEIVSHHLAGLFVSRVLSLSFWWLIRGTWLRGTTFTGWSILVVLTIQLLQFSKYMCYYVRGFWHRGLFSGVPLVCAD